MTKRIWELDALRGICILGMLAVHLIFDLVMVFRVIQWTPPAWFSLVQEWGGSLFFLLSGICVTLGSHPIRRGLAVFGCGMLCTVVTYGMFRLNLAGNNMVIRFGVLHCLGLCMLLWPLLSRCSRPVLFGLGVSAILVGLYFSTLRVDCDWLFPIGLRRAGFQSGDYFPLLPFSGFFMMGAGLGRVLYPQKTSLFPKVNDRNLFIRFLCRTGRWSLWIYLAHQPILYLIGSMLLR